MKQLKRIRERKGLTQGQVAELADVRIATISDLERGAETNPRLDTLQRIAKALGITVQDLLSENNAA